MPSALYLPDRISWPVFALLVTFVSGERISLNAFRFMVLFGAGEFEAV